MPIIFIFFTARRPPVEETTSFLNSLLASHGPNYLEKLFGSKARHRLRELGGVNTVAIALSGTLFKSSSTEKHEVNGPKVGCIVYLTGLNFRGFFLLWCLACK